MSNGNRLTHGVHTRAARERRKAIRELIRVSRETLRMMVGR